MKRLFPIICLISIFAVTGCGTPSGIAESDGLDSAESTQITTNIDEKNTEITGNPAFTEISENSGTDISNDAGENISIEDMTIIENFILYSSRQDLDLYISLFTEEIKGEMRDYINEYGAEEFFRNNQIELVSVKAFNEKYMKDYAGSYLYETERYEQPACYLVTTLNLTMDVEETNIYVIVTENGQRCLVRVSMTDNDFDRMYFE